MGFDADKAAAALTEANGDVAAAVALLTRGKAAANGANAAPPPPKPQPPAQAFAPAPPQPQAPPSAATTQQNLWNVAAPPAAPATFVPPASPLGSKLAPAPLQAAPPSDWSADGSQTTRRRKSVSRPRERASIGGWDPNSIERRQSLLRDLTLLRKLVRELTDPETQAILQDPKVRQVIQDLSGGDVAVGQRAMSDPVLRGKIEKLIASGVLQKNGDRISGVKIEALKRP